MRNPSDLLVTAPRPVPQDALLRQLLPRDHVIAVQPLGDVDPTILSYTKEVIENTFRTDVRTLAPFTQLAPHYYEYRAKYSADSLLDALFTLIPDDASRIVGVLDADMTAMDRTFVFGYGHLRDGMALYSPTRLREEWYGRSRNAHTLKARIKRVIVHELGHTCGNPHCENDCVMHAVAQIENLDNLSPQYCATCAQRVDQKLAVTRMSADWYFARAGTLLRRNRPHHATEAYNRAIALSPWEPRYHNDLGAAQIALGAKADAQQAFLRAAELAAAFPVAYYNLGIMSYYDGDKDMAATYFARGLAQEPPDTLDTAYNYLGRLHEETFGDYWRAQEYYQRRNRK